MAITITQKPTTPNVAYTDLPIVVSGSTAVTSPQFQYVMDVYNTGSIDRIARVTQTLNPDSAAVFNPAKIIQGELDYDTNWRITGSIAPVNNVKTFTFEFGEQYGTSPSSSITVYPNLVRTSIEFFPGVVDPNNGSSFNFDTGSISSNNILSNAPEARIASTSIEDRLWVNYSDYHTISYLDTDGYVQAALYDINGSILTAVGFYPTGSFNTLGIGPQNLIDSGQVSLATLQSTSRIDVTFEGTPLYTLTLPIDPSHPCTDEYVRFAFINKYGFWDYYNVYKPVREVSDIQRENVTLSHVDYSSNTATYNVSRRGDTNFYTHREDEFEVTTEWLTKETANWIEELLDSPEVYVQRGSGFLPVVITNSQYRHNNSTARNKLFQYVIQFKPANQPFGSWEDSANYVEPPLPTPPPVPLPTYPYDWTQIVSSSVPLASGLLTYGLEGTGVPISTLTSFTSRIPGQYVDSGTFSTTLTYDQIDFFTDMNVTASSIPYSMTASFYSTGSFLGASTDSGPDLAIVGGVVNQWDLTPWDEIVIEWNIGGTPPPPVYTYYIKSAYSGTDPEFTYPCADSRTANIYTVYSSAPTLDDLYSGSFAVYSDSGLSNLFNGASNWHGVSDNQFGTGEYSLQINNSGNVIDQYNCQGNIQYNLVSCIDNKTYRSLATTSSLSANNGDRIYASTSFGNVVSYTVSGSTSSSAVPATSPQSEFEWLSTNDYTGNPLTFCPSGSSTPVWYATTGSLTNTTINVFGEILDEGNWDGNSMATPNNKIVWEEFALYVKEGNFPGYDPAVNGYDQIYTNSTIVSGSGFVQAGSRGSFNHTFTGLDPLTTYSFVGVIYQYDFSFPGGIQTDLTTPIVFTTPS